MRLGKILCLAAVAVVAVLVWQIQHRSAAAALGPRFTSRRSRAQHAAPAPATPSPTAITAPPAVPPPAHEQKSTAPAEPAAEPQPTGIEEPVQLSAECVRVADLRTSPNTTPMGAAQQYIWAAAHKDPEALKVVFACFDLPPRTKSDYDATLDEFLARTIEQAGRMDSVQVTRADVLGPRDVVMDVRIQNKDGTVETEIYLMRLGPNGWVRDASVKSFLFLKARRVQGHE